MLVLKNNLIFKKTITDLFKTLLPLLGILFITKGLYIYTEVFSDVSIFESYSSIAVLIVFLNFLPYLIEFKKYSKTIVSSRYNPKFIVKNINMYSVFLMILSFFILILISLLKLSSVVKLNPSDYMYLFFNFNDRFFTLTSEFLNLSKPTILEVGLISNFIKSENIVEYVTFYNKSNLSLSQYFLENSVLFSYIFYIKKSISYVLDFILSLTPLASKTYFDFGVHMNILNFYSELNTLVPMRNIINDNFISGENIL